MTWDEERRRWVYAGAGVGSFGCLVGLVMYWRPLEGSSETIGLFLISIVVITAVLGLMNLSGFKAR